MQPAGAAPDDRRVEEVDGPVLAIEDRIRARTSALTASSTPKRSSPASTRSATWSRSRPATKRPRTSRSSAATCSRRHFPGARRDRQGKGSDRRDPVDERLRRLLKTSITGARSMACVTTPGTSWGSEGGRVVRPATAGPGGAITEYLRGITSSAPDPALASVGGSRAPLQVSSLSL